MLALRLRPNPADALLVITLNSAIASKGNGGLSAVAVFPASQPDGIEDRSYPRPRSVSWLSVGFRAPAGIGGTVEAWKPVTRSRFAGSLPGASDKN